MQIYFTIIPILIVLLAASYRAGQYLPFKPSGGGGGGGGVTVAQHMNVYPKKQTSLISFAAYRIQSRFQELTVFSVRKPLNLLSNNIEIDNRSCLQIYNFY